MNTNTQITCPNCGTEVDVNAVLYQKLSEEVQQKFHSEVAAHRKKYQEAMQQLKAKELQFKTQEAEFEQQLKKRLHSELKQQRESLVLSIKEQLEEEQKERISLMEKELEEKSTQLIELNRSKAELTQLKREKEELEERIRLETQQELNTLLEQEKRKIYQLVTDHNELKLKEKEKQLLDLKHKLEEARRKAEQGSQQTQGEVQELAIESWLQTHFPFDTIEEIKKGAKGADCLQTVHTREIPNCGTIYYESKRTKEFQRAWIEKFKSDIREKSADIGILVTEVLPKELERMGLVEGVWVCTYEEFKALSFILREHIIRLAHTLRTEENRSDKMNLLYSYLTSNEFRMQIEAIVEGFTQMKSDLESEKRAFTRIWKQREKQIQKVLDNTVGMYGSIRGIAGTEIDKVQALELISAS